MINVFGAIMQSAIVEATQAEWRKLGSASQACVDDTLRQRGLNLQALIGDALRERSQEIFSGRTGAKTKDHSIFHEPGSGFSCGFFPLRLF